MCGSKKNARIIKTLLRRKLQEVKILELKLVKIFVG